MNEHVAQIAALQGKLRSVHLLAELEHAQIAKYNELRGYELSRPAATTQSQPGHGHHHSAI